MSVVSSFQLRQAQEQDLTLPIQLAVKSAQRSSPLLLPALTGLRGSLHGDPRGPYTVTPLGESKNGASTPLAELC